MDKQTAITLGIGDWREWELAPSNVTLTDAELKLLKKVLYWWPVDGPRLLKGECQILDNSLDAHEPYEEVRAIRERCEREC